MKKLLIALTILFISPEPLAHAEYAVFGIKTDISLSDSEQAFRDVYVSMGTNQGIKVGSKLDVYRS